jgi:hypothetical protein
MLAVPLSVLDPSIHDSTRIPLASISAVYGLPSRIVPTRLSELRCNNLTRLFGPTMIQSGRDVPDVRSGKRSLPSTMTDVKVR